MKIRPLAAIAGVAFASLCACSSSNDDASSGSCSRASTDGGSDCVIDRAVVEAGAPQPQGSTWVCTGSALPPQAVCEGKSSSTYCCTN